MPKRLAKKTIGTIQNNKFRCHGNNTIFSDSCEPPTECPSECICTGTVVDCKGKNLYEIPINLPEITTEIHLQDNNIREIKAKKIFKRLKYLQRM